MDYNNNQNILEELEMDKNIIFEFFDYFERYNYDYDIVVYFLEIIASTYFYDNLYRKFDSSMDDANTYLKGMIDSLNKIEKIDFIRDINDSEYFVKNLVSIEVGKKGIGYSEDEEGHYVINYEHPTYYPSRRGSFIASKKEIQILFDEVTKDKESYLKTVLPHELRHVKQEKTDLYWCIMNDKEFVSVLLEGNAVKESQRMGLTINTMPYIPFEFNKKSKKFEMSKTSCHNVEYNLYAYLYYKFEFLLGREFMNEWTTSKSSRLFLLEANKLIDLKYGVGAFSTLYRNMQLVLLAYKNVTTQMLNREINYWDKSLEVVNALQDASLFKLMYEKELNQIETLKRIYEKVNYSALIKKQDEQLSSHTEENYRSKLIQELPDIEQVNENKFFFNDILSINISVCEFALGHSNYLTQAIYELESLMLCCIENGMSNYDSKERIYNYYTNVVNDKFDNDILSEIKENILFLDDNVVKDRDLTKLLKEIHK